MKNIIEAIKTEKEYWRQRSMYLDTYNLVDKLKEFGFKSFEEYEQQKRLYFFNNLKFNKVENITPNAVEEVFKMIDNGKSGVLLIDWDRTAVLSGSGGLKTMDTTYCEHNNIPVYPINTVGGTIVGTEEDFSLGICCPNKIKVDDEFILNLIKELIQKYTNDKVTVDGNDILIANKKVCGSSRYLTDKIYMFVAHFSFSDKTELIKNICHPDKIGKDVGYIDCMTKEDFKREVCTWLML